MVAMGPLVFPPCPLCRSPRPRPEALELFQNDLADLGAEAAFGRRACLRLVDKGFRIVDDRQVGQRSGWLKLQEAEGRRVSPLVRLVWWLYDTLSLKKEYLVVKVQGAA